MPADVAYQIVHDELMLDGNARMNLATFVTTWMEPQAEKLMAECFDKNMIDKDEYPQTAELETRCVNMLSRLWHAPDADEATGCSTTGSSEAAMLGGLALKRRWQQRRAAEGKPADRPNLVMGINVQVCWEKFANYWDVEMRLVPMEGDRFNMSAEEAVKLCDENTIGVVAILGSTFDGSYEPVKEICDALDDLQERDGARRPGPRRRRLRRVHRAVHRSRPRVGLPPAARRLDQHVGAQIRARLPGRRLDRLARRERAARGPHLLGQLPRRQHADVRAQLLAAGRPGRRAVLQLPPPRLRRLQAGAGLRARRGDEPVGADRRTRARSSCSRRATSCRCSRSRSPTTSTTSRCSTSRTRCASAAGRCPPTRSRRTGRTSRRSASSSGSGFGHDMADLLIGDIQRQLPRLQAQPEPVHDASTAAGFSH